jgi:hypothetical protein
MAETLEGLLAKPQKTQDGDHHDDDADDVENVHTRLSA